MRCRTHQAGREAEPRLARFSKRRPPPIPGLSRSAERCVSRRLLLAIFAGILLPASLSRPASTTWTCGTMRALAAFLRRLGRKRPPALRPDQLVDGLRTPRRPRAARLGLHLKADSTVRARQVSTLFPAFHVPPHRLLSSFCDAMPALRAFAGGGASTRLEFAPLADRLDTSRPRLLTRERARRRASLPRRVRCLREFLGIAGFSDPTSLPPWPS